MIFGAKLQKLRRGRVVLSREGAKSARMVKHISLHTHCCYLIYLIVVTFQVKWRVRFF